MLGPDGSHLLIARKFTPAGSGLGASDGPALLGRKGNRRRKIRACELHNGTRDVILIVRRQTAHSLKCFIKELCHGRNIGLGEVEVEHLVVLAAYLPISWEAVAQGERQAMDWLQFVASIVSSLAWPLVAIMALFLVRKKLGGLVDRVKEMTVPGGGRVTFEQQFEKIQIQTEAVVIEDLGSKATQKGQDRIEDKAILEMAGAVPEYLVIAAYVDVEAAVAKVQQGLKKVRDATLLEAIFYLRERGVISPTVAALFEGLQTTRNIIVHSRGPNRVSPGEAIEFYRMSRVFLEAFNAACA
ncbi:MAG TPA: hypothetical protein VKP67_10445 [Xanthobacteraceae bacterium]|nr:hypothetical protein [Xanthobacteraceae bacterium]